MIKPLQEIGNTWFVSRALLGLARCASVRGDHQRAARLLGSADRLREGIGASVYVQDRMGYERTLQEVHSALDRHPFEAAYVAGDASQADDRARPLLHESSLC